MKLDGKVAIITGAASGMGQAMALLFAREGATVVVADVNEVGGQETVRRIQEEARETSGQMERAAGAEARPTYGATDGRAEFVKVDVSQADQVKRLVDSTVNNYGKLNIMVNNAGVALLGKDGKIADVAEDTWDRVIAINLKGVYLGMKYAIPPMLKQGGGVIINTASIAGLVGFPSLAAYCASKGGIVQLTKATALDYGRDNLRVNAICPGVIRTAMTETMLADRETKEGMERTTPLPRLGEPEDIARAALYLASDEASFVTGTTLVVDGGWTAQ
ncbi:MAG: glucose 1-dehydrogenase [Clostridia bacterium]|nr:MAG: glucose 1-dehydrogenase [Clostridia bacterium]